MAFPIDSRYFSNGLLLESLFTEDIAGVDFLRGDKR